MTGAGTADITAVLWDCDGVLQHGVHGALADLQALVGPDVLPVLFAEEQSALRGEESLRSAVGRMIDRLGLAVTTDEVLPVWDRYRLDDAALEVLAAVRAAGKPCYLATNQQDYRRDRMRTVSGYDALVDGSFYSCEMGVAKPDPEFFRHIVTALGQPAGTLLFLDDLPANVAAARGQGLHAELIEPEDVAPQLVRILADYRIPVTTARVPGIGVTGARIAGDGDADVRIAGDAAMHGGVRPPRGLPCPPR